MSIFRNLEELIKKDLEKAMNPELIDVPKKREIVLPEEPKQQVRKLEWWEKPSRILTTSECVTLIEKFLDSMKEKDKFPVEVAFDGIVPSEVQKELNKLYEETYKDSRIQLELFEWRYKDDIFKCIGAVRQYTYYVKIRANES